MTLAHPATARINDPDIPAVAELLSNPFPGPIQAVIEAADGDVVESTPTTVTWWPGSSITVRYRVRADGGALHGWRDMVAVAGRIPDGAAVVEADGEKVGVWVVPHDPALPGLEAAVDPDRTRRLLTDLGAEDGPVRVKMRAYRPGRRAVVSVDGLSERIFLKVVRPKKVEELHENHKFLAARLPVPHSLGFSAETGMMALQAMPGLTLREVLEVPELALPAPEAVAGLAASLPAPPTDKVSKSLIERAPALAAMLGRVVPNHAGRIEEFVDRLGEDDDQDLVPVHGDFYESQLLVDNGELVGLIDVDTYGLGRAGDDPGVMLGHLALWQTMSAQPARVNEFARSLLSIWDVTHDPSDIRRRAAATLFSLATGPFRVQTADWPGETVNRIEMAHAWLASAQEA